MKELLVYMKGKWHTAAGILLLLILQAICELTIPECTANIINIGIGQSGIEDVLTEQISAEGMERLLLLMTEEEKETVLAGYTADGEVYTKNELSDGQEEELLSVMTAPMVAVYALSTDGADYEEVLGGDLYVPRGLDVFGLLSVLPDNMRIELTESTREQIRGIPQSLITQAAVNFVRDDLRVQGVDVETLQRKYLMAEGLRMLLAALGTILGASAALILAGRLAAAYAKELREAVFFQVLSFGGEELAAFGILADHKDDGGRPADTAASDDAVPHGIVCADSRYRRIDKDCADEQKYGRDYGFGGSADRRINSAPCIRYVFAAEKRPGLAGTMPENSQGNRARDAGDPCIWN